MYISLFDSLQLDNTSSRSLRRPFPDNHHHTASSFPALTSSVRPPILLLLLLLPLRSSSLPLDLTKSLGPLVLQLGVEHVAAADGGDVVA
jgi:hypothetical protein